MDFEYKLAVSEKECCRILLFLPSQLLVQQHKIATIHELHNASR